MATQLNDKQREAVETTEGAVLVIAGAGSGKTRVLTERIKHLITEKRVPPWNILAFTFTNRAAREMKERLEKTNPGVTSRLWVGTFHATGVRILRRHGAQIGIGDNFTIYDSSDSLDVVKTEINKQAGSGQLFRSPRSVRDQISRWKNELITPEMALDEAVDNIEKRYVAIYKGYEKALKQANALDFDDLIAKVVELFAVQEDVKDYYANKFQYVLVDEFQDTNPIQMAMIDGLVSRHGNLFVVGDDDQSIYSWRGAKVEHILNFESIYPDTSLIRLEQNYRSTQTILDAANHVIANNMGRKGKNLWTEGDKGQKVGLIASMDDETEAMNVLHTVSELKQAGHELKDMAILYRTNAQSRALEDVLKLGSTPYQIVGSVRFYERAEVRDILAYCKLLVNPNDNVSLKRIINVPKRGIGKTSYDRLAAMADADGVPIMDILRSGKFVHMLGPSQARKAAEFAELMRQLSIVTAENDAPKVVSTILEATNYRKHLQQVHDEADSRIENVEELVAAAEVYTEDQEDRSLQSFLEEIALVADIDSLQDEGGQLTLMTLHNAKGLEFDCVIITGLEDGLFPHANSMDVPAQLEEERRLFYVGMTRARKRLYCSFANMRRRMGVMEGSMPSRFLMELPNEFLEGPVESLQSAAIGRTQATTSFEADRDLFSDAVQYATVEQEFEDISQETDQYMYAVGMRIVHNEFGKGVVRKVEGQGDNIRVTVIFDGGGERKFLAQYAPMRPL